MNLFKDKKSLAIVVVIVVAIGIFIAIILVIQFSREHLSEVQIAAKSTAANASPNSLNKFEDFFWNKDKKAKVHKWRHYFKIYDFHFNRFIGKNPIILEIGVQDGGSLEMWNYYFDGKCQIYGIDIDEQCLNIPNKLNLKNIKIDIGNQSNRTFWKNYLKDKPKFDIVIEDGGHKMQQQIITYEELIDHVSDNGIYLCEDLHTSYWNLYGGNFKNPATFIEYSKNFVDMLNYYHIPGKNLKKQEVDKYKHFRKSIHSVHYYDSIIVLEKNIDNDTPIDSIR